MASQRGASKWLDMLLFPPAILATVLLAALLLRGSSRGTGEISASASAAGVVLYCALSWAYVTFTKRGERGASAACSLLADGVLFVYLSSELGAAAAFGWIGALLTAAGSGLALVQLAPKSKKRFAANAPDLFPETLGKAEIKAVLQTIVIPAAFLQTSEDGEERVVVSNETFAAILGRVASAIEGARFADLIPPDIESRALKFADAEWLSHRTTKGRQTMFTLSPAVRQPEPEAQASAEYAIIDPELGLFTSYYMNYKGESDVQLCRRYRRPLSAAIFTVDFNTGGLVVPDETTKSNAFIAISRMAAASIRTCDTAFSPAEHEIVILMPDTTQQGALVVIDRIRHNTKRAARIEVPELAAATISDSVVTLIGDELTTFDGLMNELYVAKGRKKR